MKRGLLTDYFLGAGVKILSTVDTDPDSSNQHEIGTTKKMRDDFLGQTQNEKFTTLYIWLGEEQDALTETGSATHYDARLNHPKRSEWRLYYKSNAVTGRMQAGDTLFLARHSNGTLLFIVTPRHSTSEQQLLWLFGLHQPAGNSFVSHKITDEAPPLDFAARYILDELGLEFEDPAANELDNIIERFGDKFPATSKLSDLARLTLPEIRAEDDPDAALVARLAHEEALFRRLERRIVTERLEQGFITPQGADIDGFISFSLSVQNRRKSRMGHSLENHIAAIFDSYGLTYERGAKTEHGHRPDFLFPSAVYYRTAQPDDPHLLMLGAKSTCKDRWRQVLAEAEKIPHKHLLTIQPAITENQTKQMMQAGLQLVIPRPVQESYRETQRRQILSLADFIKEAQERSLSKPLTPSHG